MTIVGRDGLLCDGLSTALFVEGLDKAVECMLAHTDGGVVGDALSSCDDFGVHYQSYGNFPWGQGAVLAAVAGAMSRDMIYEQVN